MTTNKTLRVFIILLCFSLNLTAQNLEKKKMKAESSFFLEKFDKARVEYEELVELEPGYKQGVYRLEVCSLLTVNHNKSLDPIKSYAKTQGRKDKFYHYWMALIYFKRKEYKQTIDACDRFLVVNKYKTREIRDEIHGLRKKAELIYLYNGQPDAYSIVHLQGKVNTKHNEYSPIYIEQRESIMFMSSHRRLGGKAKSETFHIFESKNEGDHWHSPKHIHHLGSYSGEFTSISISKKSGRLFVYSDYKGGELFYSEPQGHTWTVPEEYDEKIITSKVGSHFFINESENRILFSNVTKNPEDKTENMDIFQSFKDPAKGIWSNPIILPKTINSEQDEDYPYLSKDEKTLYFCSKGHNSIGGYDIFKSDYNSIDDEWSKPHQLEKPFNTTNDDLQFELNDDLVSGYFVSNREGTFGGFDIFSFKELNKTSVEGLVTNHLEEPFKDAVVTIKTTSSENPEVVWQTTTNDLGVFAAKVDANSKYKVEIFVDYESVHTDLLISPQYELASGSFKVHYIPSVVFD